MAILLITYICYKTSSIFQKQYLCPQVNSNISPVEVHMESNLP